MKFVFSKGVMERALKRGRWSSRVHPTSSSSSSQRPTQWQSWAIVFPRKWWHHPADGFTESWVMIQIMFSKELVSVYLSLFSFVWLFRQTVCYATARKDSACEWNTGGIWGPKRDGEFLSSDNQTAVVLEVLFETCILFHLPTAFKC